MFHCSTIDNKSKKEPQGSGAAPSTRAYSPSKEIEVQPQRVSSPVKCIFSSSSSKTQATALVQ
jgi:hypothetical protein